MARQLKITFADISLPTQATVLLFVGTDLDLGDAAKACDPDNVLPRSFEASGFTATDGSHLDIFAPSGTGFDRLTIIGTGDQTDRTIEDWTRLGGLAMGLLGEATSAAILLEQSRLPVTPEQVAAFAQGMTLRNYSFDRYKSGNKLCEQTASVVIHCVCHGHANEAFDDASAVAAGVMLARDLVNEPTNVLGTVQFADRAKSLQDHGVEIDILTETEMSDLEMQALLGVARGSAQPPRMVIMQWHGGDAGQKPVAFVGKGVVFDAGGVTMKPPSGMEGMKGDMGGAAAVTGLMQALAMRKARVNAVGIIALVENMIDGDAQRPGDIVRSMSGQTIEITNTDAEGRLILSDALHYCGQRFEPSAIIDLATLTYAIIMALGQHYAGLFSNDDALAGDLVDAGAVTGEKLWRMPLSHEYDGMLKSDIADVRNFGGGPGGSIPPAGGITSARFIQRFVGDTPWAHLDIAGTAMNSPKSEISQGWASGYGVRLLNEFVANRFESGTGKSS